MAQDTRGNIFGTVMDSQKAVIAGAKVTIANTGLGTSTKLVTNASGYYEAPLLLVGDYRVTVEHAGFKKSVRSGITLAIGDRLQIDIALEIGGATESVTVTSEAPMLDTNAVTTGRQMTHREIMDLPVLGNNVSMLARLAPGVQVPGTTQSLMQGQVGGGSDYKMPGGVGGNEWSMDGASTNGTDRRTAIMPSPDIVDEFKIETSNFDASFGHSTGLNVSMSTKSGANQLHGSATYQYFNQRWNAASFFVKQSRYANIAALRAAGNTAGADALADTPMVPAGHTNNYHGTVSGPVVIPKLLDGRNKLFFFLGYSGLKNGQAARPSEINYTVPTVAQRNGDFSGLLNVAVNPSRYQVYDPLTTRPDPARPGHFIRTPFAGNILPKQRFQNPMYDFYTKRMPLPNNDPTDPKLEPLNNYLATGMPNNVTYSSWNNRIDYQASEKHRFFFRWLKSSYLEDAQDYTYQTEPGLMAWNEKRPSKTAAADWTYTLNASTVMNVSVDVTQFLIQNQRLGTRKYKPSDVGLPAYMDTKCASSCVLPRVNWVGMPFWGDANQSIMSTNVDPGPIGRQQGLKYNISQVRGSHSMRAGIDFRQHYRTNVQNGGFTSGQFSFANTYVRKDEDGFNAAGTLGLNWAAFALGIPSNMSVDTNDTFAAMSPYYGWYAQDTWRVTRNLTLTLGLRMEYEVGPTERYDRAITTFDPKLALPIAAAAQAAYAANPLPELPANQFIVQGGSVYANQNGASRKWWRNELMYLPRVALAWQLNPKTVVRGGYGVYFDTLNVMNQGPDQYGYSRTTNTVLTNDFGQTWRAGDPINGKSPLTDPFPIRADGTRFDTPFRNGLEEMARVGQGFTYTDYNRPHPRVQRWRVGVQRELSSNMMVEASYWGQWADRVFITSPNTLKEDALPESYFATGNVRNNAIANELNRQVPNPFYIGNFTSLQTTDPMLYQQLSTLSAFQSTTVQKNRLLRPFPAMNGLNNNSSPTGLAKTNAFEFNFQRRMSKGFNLNASYTRMFQKNKTILENEFNTAPTIWWDSDSARPHRLTATAIIEFPFGKGRSFFQTGILNHLLGGWQSALTYEFQNGPLLAWGNNFYYGDVNNFVADATSTPKTLNQWFNTALPFEKNGNNNVGAYHVRIFPRYFNGLRADGLNQWNGNLLREFRIVERLRMQFRADVINLQNRSQMNAPELNPTSTNFGRVTSQTSSLNRFYQVQMRLQF